MIQYRIIEENCGDYIIQYRSVFACFHGSWHRLKQPCMFWGLGNRKEWDAACVISVMRYKSYDDALQGLYAVTQPEIYRDYLITQHVCYKNHKFKIFYTVNGCHHETLNDAHADIDDTIEKAHRHEIKRVVKTFLPTDYIFTWFAKVKTFINLNLNN